jgi:hypothetical protein
MEQKEDDRPGAGVSNIQKTRKMRYKDIMERGLEK